MSSNIEKLGLEMREDVIKKDDKEASNTNLNDGANKMIYLIAYTIIINSIALNWVVSIVLNLIIVMFFSEEIITYVTSKIKHDDAYKSNAK